MTREQKELVQASFRTLQPIAEQAAQVFYGRLFELDPSLRQLFKGDIGTQGRKLMEMIGVAVRSLDRLDNLLPTLRLMGEKHAAYGVTSSDYETVGQALIWTLEQGFGAAFTIPMWIWLTWLEFRGEGELGLVGWIAISVILAAVLVLMLLLGTRRLPAYLVEIPDEALRKER